jgi:hypothetical protein
MDDEKGGEKRFFQFIQLLKSMDEQTRNEYIEECEFEAKNGRNDGWVLEYYRNFLEAAKYV